MNGAIFTKRGNHFDKTRLPPHLEYFCSHQWIGPTPKHGFIHQDHADIYNEGQNMAIFNHLGSHFDYLEHFHSH